MSFSSAFQRLTSLKKGSQFNPSFMGAYRHFRSFSSSTNLFSSFMGSSSKSIPFTPFLISLEGNIGAGKTTVLDKMRERFPTWIAIDEPVETWFTIKNEKGESMLEVFYKDRKRWSYTFQNCALITRYQNIEKAINDARIKHFNDGGVHVFLTERCLDTDYHVFTKMLKDEGSIDKLELDLYHRLLCQLRSTATPLSAILHVNTSPTSCADRIRKRGRSGEDAITLDYLTALDQHQMKWLKETTIPTLSTDGENFRVIEDFIKHEMNQVAEKAFLLQQGLSDGIFNSSDKLSGIPFSPIPPTIWN